MHQTFASGYADIINQSKSFSDVMFDIFNNFQNRLNNIIGEQISENLFGSLFESIAGGLIGGASLKAEDFLTIIKESIPV